MKLSTTYLTLLLGVTLLNFTLTLCCNCCVPLPSPLNYDDADTDAVKEYLSPLPRGLPDINPNPDEQQPPQPPSFILAAAQNDNRQYAYPYPYPQTIPASYLLQQQQQKQQSRLANLIKKLKKSYAETLKQKLMRLKMATCPYAKLGYLQGYGAPQQPTCNCGYHS